MIENNVTRLRTDFAQGLRGALNQKLGNKGTETRDRMEKIYDSILTDGELDMEKLPADSQKELRKLQKASEQFESFFVKKLLAQMRQTSFSKDSKEKGPMMDFAKEQMDQAVADQTSQGRGSLGIAQQVFLSQGVTLVQQIASKPKQ